MTVTEALKYDLNNFVDDVTKLLIDQDIIPEMEYSKEIGASKGYRLAYANGLFKIITSPNWSQGDMSETWGDKSSIERIIATIFNRYDPENNPLPNVISTITDKSDIW